jgi:nitrite reductase/ring-hydroxylating ferredoxin subunit
MAGRERLICEAQTLVDGGAGLRFTVAWDGEVCPAFAIRYAGVVRAYLNRCSHVPVQLDWMEGQFFDLTGLYLVCSTHGATYTAESGRCVYGPCAGRGLIPLTVVEANGKVYLIEP